MNSGAGCEKKREKDRILQLLGKRGRTWATWVWIVASLPIRKKKLALLLLLGYYDWGGGGGEGIIKILQEKREVPLRATITAFSQPFRNDRYLPSCQWFHGLSKTIEDFHVPPSPHHMSPCLFDPNAGPCGSHAADREAWNSVPVSGCLSRGQGGGRTAAGRDRVGVPGFTRVKPELGVGSGMSRCHGEWACSPIHPPRAWSYFVVGWMWAKYGLCLQRSAFKKRLYSQQAELFEPRSLIRCFEKVFFFSTRQWIKDLACILFFTLWCKINQAHVKWKPLSVCLLLHRDEDVSHWENSEFLSSAFCFLIVARMSSWVEPVVSHLNGNQDWNQCKSVIFREV